MGTPLRILFIADSEDDVRVTIEQLRRDGYEPALERVETAAALESALHRQTWDVIISDYQMPALSGIAALEIVKGSGLDIPFIVVSSVADEEQAVQAIKQGAKDYLRKDRLALLGMSVARELENKRLRDQRQQIQRQSLLQTTALENAANAVVITDLKGNIRWINPAFSTLSGYTTEEALGQTPRLLKSGKHNLEFYRDLWRTVHSGQTWRGEFINRRKDGSHYVVEQTITPVRAAGGPITHFIGIMNDVTSRKQAEENLAQSHGRLKHLLNHSPAVIYSLRVEGERVVPQMVSENITRLLGFSVAECTFNWWADNLHPDDQERALNSVPETLQRETMTIEYRMRHKDGRYLWVEDSRRVVRDQTGQPVEISGVWTDITDRKRMVDSLLDSEERFRQLAENIQDVFWILDPANQQILYVSPAYETLWGRTRQSLYDSPRDWLEAIHPEDRDRVQRADKDVMEGGQYNEEYRVLRKDGSLRWVRDHAFPVRDALGQIYRIIGVARDITDSKHAEDAIRENEAKYRSLVELSPDGIIIHRAGTVVFANQVAARLFGVVEPSKLLGLSILDAVHPDSREIVKSRLALLQEGKGPLPPVEEKLVRQNGSSFDAEVVSTPFTYEGRPAALVVIRDNTEKKALQERTLRNQRLESVGTLAGGIAHDLNNVLAPILMSVEMLRENCPDEGSQKMLSTLEASAQRGAELIKQVLAFSKGVEGRRAPLQLRHIIREMQTIARQTFPKSIQFRVEFPKDLWTVEGDATQLHQVLMNLCVNARDAMPHGGQISIKTENLNVDETFARMNPEALEQPYVLLTVTDTGEGMPPEIRDRIFEPFFTTKEPGKGTGLGLSTVLGIVKSYGGFVSVYSDVRRGTRFNIYLPAIQVSGSENSISNRTSLPTGHGELVLLADDETAILEVAGRTLSSLGYQVLMASDGAEAVGLGAQHLPRLKLLITDMMMPIMDGPATIRALRRLNPGLKVIAASGLDSAATEIDPSKIGADVFLHKPFTAQVLARTVHQLLSGSEHDPRSTEPSP
jgi:PAS domain S-box-containing protein